MVTSTTKTLPYRETFKNWEDGVGLGVTTTTVSGPVKALICDNCQYGHMVHIRSCQGPVDPVYRW